MREWTAPLALAVAAYAGLCAVLFVVQRSLIYLPHARIAAAPSTLQRIEAPAATLWATTRPVAGRKAIVYFGGNAEDVSYNLPEFAAAFPDHALYLLHYRGYGGRPGRPSEDALYADALALFDHVHARHAETVVIGRSLGAAPALRVARSRPVARLVLVTPFDSLVELGAHHYPVLPVRWLLKDRYDAATDAAQVDTSTLLIAAERDEVVPRERTDALLAAFRPGVATLKVVPRSGHNTLSDRAEYLAWLRAAL